MLLLIQQSITHISFHRISHNHHRVFGFRIHEFPPQLLQFLRISQQSCTFSLESDSIRGDIKFSNLAYNLLFHGIEELRIVQQLLCNTHFILDWELNILQFRMLALEPLINLINIVDFFWFREAGWGDECPLKHNHPVWVVSITLYEHGFVGIE